jgi:hypothetical protein
MARVLLVHPSPRISREDPGSRGDWCNIEQGPKCTLVRHARRLIVEATIQLSTREGTLRWRYFPQGGLGKLANIFEVARMCMR